VVIVLCDSIIVESRAIRSMHDRRLTRGASERETDHPSDFQQSFYAAGFVPAARMHCSSLEGLLGKAWPLYRIGNVF
jgi:hypothetical protein